jgi:hypothetical protein
LNEDEVDVNLIIFDNLLTDDDFDNPTSIHIRSETILFNLSERNNYEYYFTKLNIITDNGLFFENMDDSVYSYNYKRSEFYKRNGNSILIKMDDVQLTVTRRYEKLTTVLSNLGGIMYLANTIISYFNNLFTHFIFIENIFNKLLLICANSIEFQKTNRSRISLKNNKLIEIANIKQKLPYFQSEKSENEKIKFSILNRIFLYCNKEKKKYLYEMMKKHVNIIFDVSTYVKSILLANQNLIKDISDDFLRENENSSTLKTLNIESKRKYDNFVEDKLSEKNV